MTLRMVPMRGLSLHQPWASLMALGVKRVETRSWHDPYRGPVAIASSRTFPREYMELARIEPEFRVPLTELWPCSDPAEELPLGKILAVADLVAMYPTETFLAMGRERTEDELPYGNFQPGRWAWVFQNVRRLKEPYPVMGKQGLYKVEVPAKLIPGA